MTDDVPRIRSRPWATIIVGGGTTAVVAVIGIALLAARPPAPEVRERAGYTRPMPPPSADAHRAGGVPLRDVAIETALVALADASVREAPLAIEATPFTGELSSAWTRLRDASPRCAATRPRCGDSCTTSRTFR